MTKSSGNGNGKRSEVFVRTDLNALLGGADGPIHLRRFVLLRHQDVSGVSGVGIVAEGVRFSNGVVSLRWRRDPGAIAMYNTIGDLLAVHGHGGQTEVQWLDE